MNALNYQKGFNRIFVILCLSWAFYLLWFLPEQTLSSIEQSHVSALLEQEKMDIGYSGSQMQSDLDSVNETYEQLKKDKGFVANATDPTTIVKLVFIPLIFYLVARGLVRWVVGGFKFES